MASIKCTPDGEGWVTALQTKGNHLGALRLEVRGATWCPLPLQEPELQDVQPLVCSGFWMSCIRRVARRWFSPVSLIRYLPQHISDSSSVANERESRTPTQGGVGRLVLKQRGCEGRWEANAVLPVRRLNDTFLRFPRHIPKLNNLTKCGTLFQVGTNSVVSLFHLSFLSTNYWAENRTESPCFHVNGFITVSWWHMIYDCLHWVCIFGNLGNGRNKVIPLSQIMINKWSRSTLLRKQNPSLQIRN